MVVDRVQGREKSDKENELKREKSRLYNCFRAVPEHVRLAKRNLLVVCFIATLYIVGAVDYGRGEIDIAGLLIAASMFPWALLFVTIYLIVSYYIVFILEYSRDGWLSAANGIYNAKASLSDDIDIISGKLSDEARVEIETLKKEVRKYSRPIMVKLWLNYYMPIMWGAINSVFLLTSIFCPLWSL